MILLFINFEGSVQSSFLRLHITVPKIIVDTRTTAPPLMLVTLSDIVMLVMREQPQNEDSPILVTLDGIFMLVRFLQSLNAHIPMLVISNGISILSMPAHSNALSPILVTLPSAGMILFLHPAIHFEVSKTKKCRFSSVKTVKLPFAVGSTFARSRPWVYLSQSLRNGCFLCCTGGASMRSTIRSMTPLRSAMSL